ncbi:MAG TPA: DUF87 domain-containing protein, partial [Thiotrichaceae bacterium]|nr:DUF87 domain-containing protein [Thiotrichaceae bacterium]
EPNGALTLLKNKNFTTHAAIIGMTGSGKTGLGIGLIEEAAIDNIPAIVIDPKGDMGNLCLTDPTFSGKKFEPWVTDEAQTKEKDISEYASNMAALWKKGIESHHQNSERVAKFSKVEKTIYTPGSSAGISLNILGSLDSPPQEIIEDTDTFASYLKTTVSSLLALIKIEADPLESKEYILVAQIINKAWRSGQALSIESLIGQIISPSFDKIGVLPLNVFYPQSERFKLSSKFNSILASPTFSAWLEGDSLDIQKLLYDDQGKAKIAIFSIAHLGDEERMFFVTLLLNKYIAWMRRQSGSSALKTILYMDEIYGFFPPTKNPPSKEPMLLLLKQARAFGVGVVLSTQNPVDLDYKGLSNIGTWFIGRLQTTQDIERVIDGLGGKVDSSYSKKEIKNLLSNLSKRTFFLKSAHLDDIRLFSTRWVMSYLKGPLKRAEISLLMSATKSELDNKVEINTLVDSTDSEFKNYTGLDTTISQYYEIDLTEQHHYRPHIMARYNLHFFNQTRGIDEQEKHCLNLAVHPLDNQLQWEDANNTLLSNINSECFSHLPTQAPSTAKYAQLPSAIANDKKLSKNTKDLQNWLYYNHRLELYRSSKPKLESRPYESLADFKVRLNDLLNDEKEKDIETLQERYAKKEKILLDRLERAEHRVEKEQADTTGSMLHAGVSILSALFGRSSMGTAVLTGSRILKERGDVGRAQERIESINEDIEALADELSEKVDNLAEKFDINNITIEDFAIKLRRTDIEIDEIAIVWKA